MYEPPSKRGVDTTGYDVINKGSRSAGTTGTQSKLTTAQRQAHRPGTSTDQHSSLEVHIFGNSTLVVQQLAFRGGR